MTPDATVDLERASALVDLRRTAEAISMLAGVLAADPGNVRALCLLALAHIRDGNNIEALRAAQAATSHEPDYEWPYRLASVAHRSMGDTPNAIAAARVATRLAPNDAYAHVALALALALARSGRQEAAREADLAVSLAPLDPEVHVAAGEVATANGDAAGARAALQHALALDPENVNARNNLARLDAGKTWRPGSLADAAHGFASTLAMDPRFQTGRSNLEHIMRIFLARLSYFVFLDAYLALRLTSNGPTSALRFLPVLALTLPGAYAARFIRTLTTPTRQTLIEVARERPIAAALACDAIAAIAIPIGAVSTAATGFFFVISAVLAVAARLILLSVTHSRAPDRTVKPLIGTRLVTTIAVLLGLNAATLLAGAIANRSPAAAGLGLIAGIGALLCLGVTRRRRRPRI